MKPNFRMDADFDVCLLPYSPVTEHDTLEIRAQVFNAGEPGETEIGFYLDQHLLKKSKVTVAANSYGFAHVYADMKGLAGSHTVTVRQGETEIRLPLEVHDHTKPILDGGFVMLGPPNDRKPCDTCREALKAMTDTDWQRYVTDFHKLGQSCIILMISHQYLTLAGRELTAHYPSKLYPKSDIAAHDPIGAILTAAENNGQKVFIGVGNQFGHKGTAEEMSELYERYKGFRSFYGWYLATELRMDATLPEHLEKWNLYNYLREYAKNLCPVKPILISPMGMPSEEFAQFFQQVEFCDILMPQDWVGQCAFHIEDSEEMHRRLAPVCKAAGKHLWANCEGFNFTDTPDGKWENWGCTFKDFPWDAPRVLVPRFRGGGMVGEQGFDRQIKAAEPYVEKIMTFMLSVFFCPPDFTPAPGGQAAIDQYNAYVAYMKQEGY